MPQMTTTQPPPQPPYSPHPTMYSGCSGYFGAFLFGVGNLFPLFLFCSFFRFSLLTCPEERKLRVTGTRTFTRTRWTQGVSCYASTFAAFGDFFLFLRSLLFMFVPRLPLFGSKERFGDSSLGCPLFDFILGLTILLKPLVFSTRFRGC